LGKIMKLLSGKIGIVLGKLILFILILGINNIL